MKRVLPLVLLTIVSAAACASSAESADEPTPAASADAAAIRVENNAGTLGALNIFLVPQVGQRVFLGTVEAGAVGNFNYTAQPGNYHIVAQRQGGGNDVRSQSFNLRNGQLATWNLSLNRVVVGTR